MTAPTFARKQHGNARNGGRLLGTESKPWDEQPKAANVAPPIERDPSGRVVGTDAARRLANLPRHARVRVPKGARAFRRLRGLELERSHGHVSAGVAAMLDAEACAWLAGQKAASRAAETGDREDIATMTRAFETARALAKDAWSLAAFEAETMAANTPASDPLAPFMPKGDDS